MLVLGISCFYHDSAAALLRDGDIIAAAQEERFTRKKHDAAFPHKAIQYCLDEAGIKLGDVDHAVFYEKPFLKFERLLETYLAFAPRGFTSFRKAIPLWLREKLFQKDLLRKKLAELEKDFDWEAKLLFAEHHQSHAASAFFASPFEEAMVLVMDGVGEWATASLAHGKGAHLEIHREIHFPHSLGLLYSAFTYYCGFRVNSGEYKLMGLAPYGEPKYVDTIRDNLIDIKEDGSFRLDLDYFDYCTGLTMTNKRFDALFGRPPRQGETQLEQFHMDLAASIQNVTEEVVLRIAESTAKDSGIRNLCLAGGVALNCVANGKLVKSKAIDRLWIQPAAGDAGGALGAALTAYYMQLDNERVVQSPDAMKGGYLGPSFPQDDIEARLHKIGARFTSHDDDEALDETVAALCDEKVVGWFQGRMEFGPRALGGRSIIGDPRSSKMQKTMNLKIKYRESFRPFAPSVRREDVADWFDLDGDSPYMLLVANVHPDRCRSMSDEEQDRFGIDKLNVVRSEIPAVTHVDYSARIQTVHRETNPRYHELLTRFKAATGCPIVVNTSFNVRGEPIVGTPEDAFRCFMGTEMDFLIIGNAILRRPDQDPALKQDYKNAFALD